LFGGFEKRCVLEASESERLREKSMIRRGLRDGEVSVVGGRIKKSRSNGGSEKRQNVVLLIANRQKTVKKWFVL
jgi:hypothetical protein